MLPRTRRSKKQTRAMPADETTTRKPRHRRAAWAVRAPMMSSRRIGIRLPQTFHPTPIKEAAPLRWFVVCLFIVYWCCGCSWRCCCRPWYWGSCSCVYLLPGRCCLLCDAVYSWSLFCAKSVSVYMSASVSVFVSLSVPVCLLTRRNYKT